MQILLAVRHVIGAQTEAVHPTEDRSCSNEDEDCQVPVSTVTATTTSVASKSAAADAAAAD